jgi:hypothetical protein
MIWRPQRWRIVISVLATAAPVMLSASGAENPEAPAQPQAVVSAVQKEVQPLIDVHLADAQAKTMKELTRGGSVAARFKHPARVKSMTDPWGALADMERQGLRVAELARGGLANLDLLVQALTKAPTEQLEPHASLKPKIDLEKADLTGHVAYMRDMLDQAERHRVRALQGLTPEQRKQMFEWAPKLLASFGPQTAFNTQLESGLKRDLGFFTAAHEVIDWKEFLLSFQHLAALTDPPYLAALKKVLEKCPPIQDSVPGVTGEILYRAETPEGLIIIGGKGPNTYDLKQPVALLIDLGGGDHYKGVIGSSFDAEHALSLVIDFDGDDVYEPNDLGLATGRLGIGMLVDLAGDDKYLLKTGCGAVGLAGIGVLCDAAGNDVYTGSQYTQGVGFGGLGLLLDLAGNDVYTSHGFAIGFGGPCGVGAVIDVAGDDSYQCSKHFPSGYNQSDAPNAKPGDSNFQYDAWGIGMGLGRRIWPPSPESDPCALAGGVGIVIDVAGKDRYESSNFSQGFGYFFGIGVKLDLAGDDSHLGARYGHAAAAHFGMGLFVDYAGNDRYESVGPTYNCGCAWDRSVALCIDASGDDVYVLERSAGLGLGDIGSWGVFADLGGKDQYVTHHGLGRASRDGLAVFFDRAGEDDYAKAPKHGPGQLQSTGNGQRLLDGLGGLFVDR